MSGHNNKDLLNHIVAYCVQINEANSQFDSSYELFCNNSVYRNAVAMCLLQIGELAKHLTNDFCNSTSDEIPWKQIRGLRNIVAHEYGNIDEESLWETVTEDVPVLLNFCNRQIELIESDKSECEDDGMEL